MSSYRTLRHTVIVATLIGAFLSQGTWALAGVTGNIAGTLKDASGAPVAGATVQAVAASQSKTVVTDAGGHFTVLSLNPDTYTLNVSKAGYQSVSFPGIVVFADQTQQVAYTLQKSLRTIAHVTSQAAASLVKPGVGGDLYSVGSSQIAAAAGLGGGGNMNNAFSAMSTVPGLQTSQGGLGWDFNQAQLRGSPYYNTGFEYDGIPVNRSFDNYPSSTNSTLGLQELQVYTGGGPASVASAGTAGFINQVIKTGTFPGFATANLGIATPIYYHQASVEIGGSTPDRTFSYYVGLLGYNQDYRLIDNSNGAGYMTPGGIFSGNTIGDGIGYGFLSDQVLATGPTCLGGTAGTCQGVKPMCPAVGKTFTAPPQGCWQFYGGLSSFPQQVSDREDVINLHMGIPKSNGLRDDVQLLWSSSALNNYFYQSPSDMGPGVNQFIYSAYGTNYKAPTCGPETVAPGLTVNGCTGVGQILPLASAFTCGVTPPSAPSLACAPTYLAYADGVAYNEPFGTTIARNATSIKPPSPYYAPDTPAHPFDGPIPLTDNSVNPMSNDTGVTKLQYTFALSQAAYLRLYGYTLYSDWLQTSPSFGSTDEETPTVPEAQYDLITHTSGGALDFQDQLNDQNLITLDGNYVTAGVIRFNNSSAYAGNENSPIGYMSKGGPGGYTCYDPTTGAPQLCITASSYYDVATKSPVAPTWYATAESGPTGFGIPGSAAAKAGATWDSLWQGNVSGLYNTVRPRFYNGSLSDQFRPSDKFLINAAIRYDQFTYALADSDTAADNFYAQQIANYTCVYSPTNTVLTVPLPPGVPPPAAVQYVVGNCNQAATQLHPTGPHTGWVHPNGTVQNGVAAPNFTATTPGSYSLNYWQPRVSATYTITPDSVIRASAGRYTQPPISASVDYLSASGDATPYWGNFMNLGFYSPFHAIPGISSGQYDLSWENHFKGTDMSFKLTPFYTWVSGWQQDSLIGANFVTQIPVGVARNEGVEFQFNKGDFSRNGLSGQLSFTYTNAQVRFENYPLSGGGVVTNQITALNSVIAQYNMLTKAGGGSPCYQDKLPVPCNTPNGKIAAGFDTIFNPYYNQPEQGLLDPGAWYHPYTIQVAPSANGNADGVVSPYVGSIILNWRQNKLAITPSISFLSGSWYGTPLDTTGYDPRACVLNSAGSGITKLSPKTNPLQCNYLTATAPGFGTYGYFYIPNPQSGLMGFQQYINPDSIVGNLQISYDVSPRIRLTLIGVDLGHTCFGGTPEPWTAASPPGNAICGYTAAGGPLNSTLYPGNYYNGTGINDVKANGARTPFTQSYIPSTLTNGQVGAAPQPINVYFNAQVRI